MPPALIRLVYLDQRMLAEPIRLALTIGNVPFEDERIGYDEVAKRRVSGALPFGQVPVMIVEESDVNDAISTRTISQTSAILRWAGKQAKLYDCVHSDEIEAALADVRINMGPQWYGSVLGRSPVDGSQIAIMSSPQKEEIRHALETAVLPARFKALEKQVQGSYFCGEQLTICDLSWYNMCMGLLEGWYCAGITKKVLTNCPKLISVAKLVHNLPGVQAWNKDHGYSTPPALL